MTSTYSRDNVISLPADDDDLTTAFASPADYNAVASNDGTTVDQSGTEGYALFEWKETATGNSGTFTWKGESTKAPSESKVQLQIYKRTGTGAPVWEDVPGASNNSEDADTNFTIGPATVSPLDDYKAGGTNEVALRTWQAASGGSTWDISTAAYVNNFVTALGSGLCEAWLKSDGTKMYVFFRSSRIIYQYSLSPAWDITSANYDSVSFSCATQIGDSRGIAFSADGNHFYIADVSNAPLSVHQYDMTSWDLSTAGYASKSFAVGNAPFYPTFNADGTKAYISVNNGDYRQYTLNPAWDIGSAVYDSLYYAVDVGFGAFIKPDGSKFYSISRPASNYIITQWSMTSGDISTLTSDSKTFDAGANNIRSIFIKSDGFVFYLGGNTTNAEVEQYSMS